MCPKFQVHAATHRYVWSDFGGKREGLNESAEETACREFSEETLGLWGGLGDIRTRISNSISIMRPKIQCAMSSDFSEDGQCFVLKNGLYINFIVPVKVISDIIQLHVVLLSILLVAVRRSPTIPACSG